MDYVINSWHFICPYIPKQAWFICSYWYLQCLILVYFTCKLLIAKGKNILLYVFLQIQLEFLYVVRQMLPNITLSPYFHCSFNMQLVFGYNHYSLVKVMFLTFMSFLASIHILSCVCNLWWYQNLLGLHWWRLCDSPPLGIVRFRLWPLWSYPFS